MNNRQHTQAAMIVTLALLDEAESPGVFERKLKEACNDNGIPEVKYKLEPDTAKKIKKSNMWGTNYRTKKKHQPGYFYN